MRRLVSLGVAASLVAFSVPAMAQQQFIPHGNNGGHAMSGGGYANGVAPGGAPVRNFGGGGFHRGGGGYGGQRRYGGNYRNHGGFGGAAIGAGVAGLAAGALIGGAIANQQPGYGYGYGYDPGPGPAPLYDEDADAAPPPGGGDEVAYCQSRYRSYDPQSGTYLGFDGERHPCP